ncbi:helix-turn-helix domain-containing protein [Streptomyces sp. NPDC096132]|uniref:helix-turn-helix domain-containing protein n=1 Tax=Streptomyces sp. NPDC096132 TaxID=3366075 RepID=UPI0038094408
MSRSALACAPERPFAALAKHLIGLRRAARLPQRALADVAAISRTAVQRAESGIAAPSPSVLDAYVRGCRASPEDLARARLLRRYGRITQRGRLRSLRAPSPALIHSADDLGLALAAMYEQDGAPALREFSRRVTHRPPLPVTSVWRFVHRKGLPASTEQLVTYLMACGISPAEQRLYVRAYQRIVAGRGERPGPPRTRHRAARPDELAHYTDKISPTYRSLMDRMSAVDVETALTVGVAYVYAEQSQRNGVAPITDQQLFRTARRLFGADTGPAQLKGVPATASPGGDALP